MVMEKPQRKPLKRIAQEENETLQIILLQYCCFSNYGSFRRN